MVRRVSGDGEGGRRGGEDGEEVGRGGVGLERVGEARCWYHYLGRREVDGRYHW